MEAVAQAQDRLDIIQKIRDYEKKGWFDKDVEDDPPTKELLPENVDYLQKKLSSKIKTKYAYYVAGKFLKKALKNKFLIIKDIIGIENWQNLTSGAVITCNHFNAMDSFAMQVAYQESKQKHKKMFKVIREGNYTNFPGFYGLLMRHCNTLPLSSNRRTMENFIDATNKILKRGDFVLMYPEQSMWWNYKKPKPLKQGAFKFAVNNDVPVLPCFITFEDSDKMGPDGFYVQEYTIHVGKPLYPNKDLEKPERIQNLLKRNEELWKNCYEKTYGKKLEYTTE